MTITIYDLHILTELERGETEMYGQPVVPGENVEMAIQLAYDQGLVGKAAQMQKLVKQGYYNPIKMVFKFK